jgi:hypothetical protein
LAHAISTSITASALEVCATACRFFCEQTTKHGSTNKRCPSGQPSVIFESNLPFATPQISALTPFPVDH